MFQRMIVAVITFAALLCSMVSTNVEAAKSDQWLIYWYICGSNLESNFRFASKDIAEMEHVKLPANVKILIAVGGSAEWHHPTIAAGGEGIYLYSSNRLEKVANWLENGGNMGEPATLAQFLKFGEENYSPDRRILMLWNHGGLNGLCYDDVTDKRQVQTPQGVKVVGVPHNLTYDKLRATLSVIYPDAPENLPFELIGFKACLTGSYELANSIADFSHYMVGAEPSIYDWPFSMWIAELAKKPDMNGAQIGRIICDSALKNYDDYKKTTHTFSVVDLTKMPKVRKAYEEYFDEAFARSAEEGFIGAFARAAENPNVDKYSELYGDLGLIAKNTKDLMPKTSQNLLNAIDRAVVYKKNGDYLKSKGLSTYYPYLRKNVFGFNAEAEAEKSANILVGNFKNVWEQKSSYDRQKEFYKNLLTVDISDALITPLERKDGHFVAQLEPDQLGKFSSVECLLMPVTDNARSISGMVLTSADDFKVNWKKGTVTENFRATEPVFDGQRIAMFSTLSGRGYNFYDVPVIIDGVINGKRIVGQYNLKVRYDLSTKKYKIFGIGDDVENGVVRGLGFELQPGMIITPLFYVGATGDGSDLGEAIVVNGEKQQVSYRNADGTVTTLKLVAGKPFVYTNQSEITNRTVSRGNYCYIFMFRAPNGVSMISQPGLISIKHGKIKRLTYEELESNDAETLDELTDEAE